MKNIKVSSCECDLWYDQLITGVLRDDQGDAYLVWALAVDLYTPGRHNICMWAIAKLNDKDAVQWGSVEGVKWESFGQQELKVAVSRAQEYGCAWVSLGTRSLGESVALEPLPPGVSLAEFVYEDAIEYATSREACDCWLRPT